MNTVNVHLIFLVNHAKSHGTSFIKQKYLTEITLLLLIYKLIISSQTVFPKYLTKPFWQRGLEKPQLAQLYVMVRELPNPFDMLLGFFLHKIFHPLI